MRDLAPLGATGWLLGARISPQHRAPGRLWEGRRRMGMCPRPSTSTSSSRRSPFPLHHTQAGILEGGEGGGRGEDKFLKQSRGAGQTDGHGRDEAEDGSGVG